MVEVFKTNVITRAQAKMLIEKLHLKFKCEASFDLEDCDRILRVKCISDQIQVTHIIQLLEHYGYHAEVLPENYPLPIIQSIINASLCQ